MHGSNSNDPQGLSRSISPGTPVPDTVLVVVMNDGSYLLVGYPQGEPSAYVISEDAVLLRQVLAAAFGSEPSADNEVALHGSDLLPGKATQL